MPLSEEVEGQRKRDRLLTTRSSTPPGNGMTWGPARLRHPTPHSVPPSINTFIARDLRYLLYRLSLLENYSEGNGKINVNLEYHSRYLLMTSIKPVHVCT